MIQDRVPSEASSEVRMVGNATFTMVVSSSAIETPRTSTASAIHELRGVASGAPPDAAGAEELVTGVRLSEKGELPDATCRTRSASGDSCALARYLG
ncbi:hypothetical protein GCM10027063_49420 [Promicromonospora xylanilytica]